VTPLKSFFIPSMAETLARCLRLTGRAYMYLSVSPDERYLLYTTEDDPVYEMMLVENFR